MKFLVFQHVAHEHPGLITQYAQRNNITLDVIKLWEPYIIPAADGYDALIIMGGPMGINDDAVTYPSKQDEITFIKKHIGTLPMIGFCLGSQLIAHCIGGHIFQNKKDGKRAKEIGFYKLGLTSEGKTDLLFKDFSSPFTVLEWHGDAFTLPNEATLLATSELCENQAFRYENAYGTLFHFEFTPAMIDNQIKIDNEWMHAEHTIDDNELRLVAKQNEKLMREQCNRLLDNFISTIT